MTNTKAHVPVVSVSATIAGSDMNNRRHRRQAEETLIKTHSDINKQQQLNYIGLAKYIILEEEPTDRPSNGWERLEKLEKDVLGDTTSKS
jgi:hypothetical protein